MPGKSLDKPEAQAKDIERYVFSNALRLRFRLVSPVPAHSDGKSGAPIHAVACSSLHSMDNFAACQSHPARFQCIISRTIRAAWITLARSAAVIAPRAMMSSRLRRVWFIR